MRRTFDSTPLLAALLLLGLAPLARAEVTASGPPGFSLKIEVPVSARPDEVFTRFLRIGEWWSDAHTYSGKAANMTLDANPGGCFCERLPRGGFVRHMAVVFFAPGKTLRLEGGLGPLQGMGASGVLSFEFKPESAGPEAAATRLTVTYTVTGFAAGKGLAELAPAVDEVIAEQVARFKRFAETGKPTA
jgi:hypothetical protein